MSPLHGSAGNPPDSSPTSVTNQPRRSRFGQCRLLALADGKPAGVLLEITGVESVSKGSRPGLYSEASTVAAFALLGRSPGGQGHRSLPSGTHLA